MRVCVCTCVCGSVCVCVCVCVTGISQWWRAHTLRDKIFLGFIPVLVLALTSLADLAKLLILPDSQFPHLKIGIRKSQPDSLALSIKWDKEFVDISTVAGTQAALRRRQWHPTPILLPGKSHRWRSLVGCRPWGRWESDPTERLHFHFHALEEATATHPCVLAWRIPGTAEPGGLPSMGLHRVGHYWSDLAAVST